MKIKSIAIIILPIILILGLILSAGEINNFLKSNFIKWESPYPHDSAARQIKNAYKNQGELKSEKGYFNPSTSLNGKSIAQRAGILSEDQVCISAGDFINQELFQAEQTIEKSSLQYLGENELYSQLSIICDSGANIRNSIERNGLNPEWFDSCQTCSNQQRACCFIALRNA